MRSVSPDSSAFLYGDGGTEARVRLPDPLVVIPDAPLQAFPGYGDVQANASLGRQPFQPSTEPSAMHTPGPWRWTNGDEDIDIATYDSPGYYNNPEIHGANGEFVIGCDEYWIIGPATDGAQQIANARLLVTAPEMLIAAEEARSALYGAREVLGQIANIQHAIDLLNAAIAKAKGT